MSINKIYYYLPLLLIINHYCQPLLAALFMNMTIILFMLIIVHFRQWSLVIFPLYQLVPIIFSLLPMLVVSIIPITMIMIQLMGVVVYFQYPVSNDHYSHSHDYDYCNPYLPLFIGTFSILYHCYPILTIIPMLFPLFAIVYHHYPTMIVIPFPWLWSLLPHYWHYYWHNSHVIIGITDNNHFSSLGIIIDSYQ